MENNKELVKAWEQRLNLYAEGNKLRAEGYKLYAEGYKLHAEGNKLRAEGYKLWAESVIAQYGNIIIEWKNWDYDKKSYSCVLENGEVYDQKHKKEDGLPPTVKAVGIRPAIL